MNETTTTPIHVLDHKVRLLQAEGGFRTSLDSVMLAAACPAREDESILDLGCGVGGAGLCVLWRVPDTTLHGVEIQPCHADLARRNAALNGAEQRASFTCSDIRAFKPQAVFDHVICNPPYAEDGAHTRSPSAQKAAAMGNIDAAVTLKHWIDCAFDAISGQGSLTMIHQAGATDEIIRLLGKRFGATEIIPLWPRAGMAAKRVIIRSRKHRKSPCILHPGLVLHEADGRYTAAADAILRDGAPLL